ncbi:ribosome biogenesis protein ALB1 [Scheffersomyces amazonensis]|uniref:ribosome biogenesis protein ALB1 n=1 Tax=Scheffersomyces amazonensis TaxID=1078765 RepID=UPI00315D208F
MASKNSINKPKNKINSASHAKSLAKKRAARSKILPNTRSSIGRYADKAVTAVRPTDSKAIALYTGESPAPISKMTKNTLSNKRAKKIARNQKYVDQRKQAENKEEDASMEIETKEQLEERQTNLDKVKTLLWSVIEQNARGEYKSSADGEGTTLGIQAF